MNTHKNARLTYLRRLEMVHDIKLQGLSAAEAALRHGVSAVTARKWLARYLAGGANALLDKSSKPSRSPRSISERVILAIVELRRKLMLQAQIASYVGVSKATVSRVLRRAGLSRLSDLRPQEPVQRYERQSPGELLHIDSKKLGRIERAGHRVTGTREGRVQGAGWEFLFVAVDDHSRIAFTQMYPDERKESAVSFLQAAAAYYDTMGVQLQRLITDNGPAFHSKSLEPTAPKPTARQSGSSSQLCASGPMATPMTTLTTAKRLFPGGITTTTGTARTTASAANRLSPGCSHRETTS